MISLSLCMIVKNEEELLARCLDSVAGVFDEIIIVDTGSRDKTKEIAKKYTSDIYDFAWRDDFSAARNYAFSKAGKDFIMWLDADDVLTKNNRKLLLDLKKTLDPNIDVVMMKYDVAFDKVGKATYSYYRERILKREKNFKWQGEVHEAIEPAGNIIFSDIRIEHRKTHKNKSGRNLKIYKKILLSGKKLDSRQNFYYARELMDNKYYREAVDVFLTVLDDENALLENKITACQNLAFCYYQTGNDRAALKALLGSFVFDKPRAEICCDLGLHFFNRGQYRLAIYWYDLAYKADFDEKGYGFYDIDSHSYLPAIGLCLCYDRLGDYKKAMEWNEKAGLTKPYDESYLHNKAYFEDILALD